MGTTHPGGSKTGVFQPLSAYIRSYSLSLTANKGLIHLIVQYQYIFIYSLAGMLSQLQICLVPAFTRMTQEVSLNSSL